MIVTIKYLSWFNRLTYKDQESLELPEGSTLTSLEHELALKYPYVFLTEMKDLNFYPYIFVVNGKSRPAKIGLKNGDCVSIIGLICGG